VVVDRLSSVPDTSMSSSYRRCEFTTCMKARRTSCTSYTHTLFGHSEHSDIYRDKHTTDMSQSSQATCSFPLIGCSLSKDLQRIGGSHLFMKFSSMHMQQLSYWTRNTVLHCVFFVLLLWSPYGTGQTILFLPCGFFYLSIFLFSLA